MSDELKEIFDEAATILRIVATLRADQRLSKTAAAVETISAAALLSQPILPRGEPHPHDHAASAFTCAIRFWAKRVAASLDYDQWMKMCWYAHDAVPEYQGDQIRFFENAFVQLRLRDGELILA